MDPLPDPPRWSWQRLDGVAGSWPPVALGRDVLDRHALTVMIPAVGALTVWWVAPVPRRWMQFPPHRWRRRWWGWEPRRPR